MTPHPGILFGFVQQIFLLVFILMLFVSFAGGKPDSVLKPFFDLAVHMTTAMVGLLCNLLLVLFRLVIDCLGSLAKAMHTQKKTLAPTKISTVTNNKPSNWNTNTTSDYWK